MNSRKPYPLGLPIPKLKGCFWRTFGDDVFLFGILLPTRVLWMFCGVLVHILLELAKHIL
jgi:hypothetical protein